MSSAIRLPASELAKEDTVVASETRKIVDRRLFWGGSLFLAALVIFAGGVLFSAESQRTVQEASLILWR